MWGIPGLRPLRNLSAYVTPLLLNAPPARSPRRRRTREKVMRLAALSLCLIVVVVLAGCGSASQPPIALTFPSGSAQAIDNGQSVTITVTGAGSQGVTWSLSGPGSLTNQTLTS